MEKIILSWFWRPIVFNAGVKQAILTLRLWSRLFNGSQTLETVASTYVPILHVPCPQVAQTQLLS